MIPDGRLYALSPRWQQSRAAESAACKSRKGLRDIVPASDLEPFRSSPWKMMWTYGRSRYYMAGVPRSRSSQKRPFTVQIHSHDVPNGSLGVFKTKHTSKFLMHIASR